MIIRVSELQSDGLTITDPVSLGPLYADPGWRLCEVQLHVRREDADVVVQGMLRASVPQVCGRCLEAFPFEVRAEVDSRFLPRPQLGESLELSDDDLATDFYEADQLDLGALIETETTLALPMKPLCREGCRGLCPVCGVNRNAVTCGCDERKPDPRLAVLKDLAARLKH